MLPALRLPSQVISRSFAKKAAAAVEAPIRIHGAHGRYAHALYQAAGADAAACEKDLVAIQAAAKASPDFHGFLTNPSIQKVQKVKGVVDAVKAAMPGAHATSLTFLAVVGENNRLSELNEITNKYKEIMRAVRGEMDALVTVAQPVDAATKKHIAEMCKAVAGGKDVEPEIVVDPTILGGCIVQIEDKYIDASVATQLTKLEVVLTDAV